MNDDLKVAKNNTEVKAVLLNKYQVSGFENNGENINV